MKKMVIVGECFFAIFILVLASIPVTAVTQTKSTKEKSVEATPFVNHKNLLENKKTLLQSDWYPGELIGFLINLILSIIAVILLGHTI